MTMTDVGAELAIRAQPVLPMAPEQARQVMAAYQETCKAILTKDDVQRVGDREFTKRSGFQKLGAAYGVSTEIVSQQLDETERSDTDETTTVYVARAVVRAIHPSGRHAEGDGTCASNEKRFRRGDEKLEHSLMATAVTRATNRAISNLIAFGTVSAEEAEASAGSTAALPGWASPAPDITKVAHALTALFKALGTPEPGKAAVEIGNQVFKDCSDTVPVCVARAISHIVDLINETPETVDATASEEPTTTEEVA